jgi:hypothetical protein
VYRQGQGGQEVRDWPEPQRDGYKQGRLGAGSNVRSRRSLRRPNVTVTDPANRSALSLKTDRTKSSRGNGLPRARLPGRPDGDRGQAPARRDECAYEALDQTPGRRRDHNRGPQSDHPLERNTLCSTLGALIDALLSGATINLGKLLGSLLLTLLALLDSRQTRRCRLCVVWKALSDTPSVG